MTDVAAGKVPVLKCFEQAWRFLFQHWRLFAPAAVIPALANGLAVAMSPSSPAAEANLVSGLGGILLVEAAGVFFAAAVLRKAVRDEFVAPWGLAAGQDEIRLFGILGCFAALFILPVALAAFALDTLVFSRIASTPEELSALQADPQAFNAALLQALGEGGLVLLNFLAFVFIFLFVAGLIAWVRLSMANAATMGERRMVFFQSWRWSKGNVLRVLAALAITLLSATLLSLIVGAVVLSIVGAGPAPVQFLAGAVAGFVQALLSIPSIALGAILYKGLRPPDFVAK